MTPSAAFSNDLGVVGEAKRFLDKAAFDVVGGLTGLKESRLFFVGESTRMLAALSSTFLRFKDSEGRLFFCPKIETSIRQSNNVEQMHSKSKRRKPVFNVTYHVPWWGDHQVIWAAHAPTFDAPTLTIN
jgi:hypothetical protein